MPNRTFPRYSAIASGLLFALSAQAQEPVLVDLPSANLAQSLNTLARQASVQIIFSGDIANDRQAPALKGNYTPQQALKRLLNNTGLALQSQGERTYIVVPAPAEPVASATTDVQPLALQESVISATRTEASIASIPGSAQVIDEQQIREQSGAGRRVTDVLAQLVPGIAPASGGMGNSGQTLRGRNILVLIDGVSQNATRDVSRQLNSISPDSIARIEVVSGASSVYGAGASGGIINIITKHNDGQDLSFSTKVGLTTADNFNKKGFSYQTFQSATGHHKDFDWYLSADLTQRNDQFDGNSKRIPQDTSQGSNMDTETYDLQGRFGYQLDDNRKVTLGLQRYQDKQDTDYTKDPGNTQEALAIKGLQLEDQPYTRNEAVNLNYTDSDFFAQGLVVESYWRKADALFFPDLNRGLAGVSATNSVQQVYGLRTALDTTLPSIGTATGHLVWGADYNHEVATQDGDQYRVNDLSYTKTGTTYDLGPEIATTNRALFAQMSWDIADWTLRGGIRREWIESKLEDSVAYGDIVRTGTRAVLPGGTLKYDDTLYNLGAVYHIDEYQDVFANFSQGFSLPDIQRFLRDVSATYDIQNLNAQALKVDSYELGWRGKWNDIQADVSVYENTSDVTQYFDAIDRVLRLVSQKERVRGIETSLAWYATEAWSMGGTYAWTKGETQQDGKWIDLPATRISPAKSTLFTAYSADSYNIRLQAMHLSSYDAAEKDNNGRAVDGYTLVDLIGSLQLPVGRLESAVYNLTDRNYQSLLMQASGRAPYINAQGRTFSLSYALDW